MYLQCVKILSWLLLIAQFCNNIIESWLHMIFGRFQTLHFFHYGDIHKVCNAKISKVRTQYFMNNIHYEKPILPMHDWSCDDGTQRKVALKCRKYDNLHKVWKSVLVCKFSIIIDWAFIFCFVFPSTWLNC